MKASPDEHVPDTQAEPTVSVIVPVFNASRTLRRCLRALLALEYPREKLEILIVDNMSTDDTREIIEEHPVTCLCQDEIQSSYAARNAGIAHSRGEVLAFTDSDCLPEPSWLREGTRALADPGVGAVAGRIVGAAPSTLVETFLQRSNYLGENACLQHPFLPYVQTANAFYRRSVLEEIGHFHPRFVSGGDADLSWRMQLQTESRIAHCPTAIVRHQHRAGMRLFFRQAYTHGVGKADLEHLYRRHFRAAGVPLTGDRPLLHVLVRMAATLAFHFLRSVYFLLTFRMQSALFEWVDWWGKLGKSVGFRRRQRFLSSARGAARG